MDYLITYRNITYRLYPGSAATTRQLLGVAGACRFVWNEIKAAYELQYEHACGRSIAPPTFQTFGPAFTELRRQHAWLQEYPFAVVRYSVNYLAEAYRAFFRRGEGYPRWKHRYQDPSFTIPQDVRVTHERLYVPKVGWLRIGRRGGNPYSDSEAVKVVVKRIGKRWYATVCHKVLLPVREDDGTAIGVDCNVRQIADCDEIHRQPDHLRVLEAKHKRHQRLLSRKKKGSNRRRKQKARMQRAARRQAQARKAWQHRVTRRIASKAHTVAIEDLNTRGMTRSAKGSVERPGTHVKAKAGLNREIRKTGWGAIRSMLEYKAGECIVVNPAFTSQTCSECGVVDADSRRSQANFMCVACGYAQNADLNAARNILASATGASARRGALGLPTPATREMDTEGVNLCI